MDRPPAQKWDEKYTLPSTFVSLFISPDKSDILNQTVSSSIDNKPFGPEHCNSPDTHLHTCSHPHVWGDKQALTYCICLPWSYVSIIQHLRDSLSVRFSTAGMCSTDAEHLEQHHLVHMNEPVSLNTLFLFFYFLFIFLSRWRESVVVGAFSHYFISFQFWELKCKMCNIWWLLVFILAQRGQQNNVKMKLEDEKEISRTGGALFAFMLLLLWQKAVN